MAIFPVELREMLNTRRPIAAYTHEYADVTYEVVVCTDGAVFYRPIGVSAWTEDVPIPGTRAANGEGVSRG
jgi:hypothetical protein